MRRLPALLLVAALLGGLGASSVHRAQHGVEWADAQRTHAEDHHETGGEHASTPCLGGDLHAIDCAVCSGVSGVALAEAADLGNVLGVEQQQTAAEDRAAVRRAATPARGPPVVA